MENKDGVSPSNETQMRQFW